MKRLITLEEGLKESIIKLDDSIGGFLFVADPTEHQGCELTPEQTGSTCMQRLPPEIEHWPWSLHNLGGKLAIVGPPTDHTILLCGMTGYEEGPNTLHLACKEMFNMPATIGNQSKSLIIEEYKQFQQDPYQFLFGYKFWLASRCVISKTCLGYFNETHEYLAFNMFYAHDGVAYNDLTLHGFYSDAYYKRSLAIRPISYLKSNILVDIEEKDGSYEHPLKLIGVNN